MGYAIFVRLLRSCNFCSYFDYFKELFKMMQGLTFASLKRHPALIPLYVCLGAGVGMSAFYTLRLATRNPDVSWNRTGNPEPQQAYMNKQYKFYSPIRDYSTYKVDIPNYKD